ncbi:unnamed protein product [Parnassius apollo]|uniref:(apollo) hypothetical protein n=1 Tax=Parnassius apollo TaxID=110799 RepID=A0A8S3X8P3_PARAO|nr:unnamed protein product [Parnassius apollo]
MSSYNNYNVVNVMKSLTDGSNGGTYDPSDVNSPINIDLPTIFNNIRDVRQFNLLSETSTPEININNKSKVKILSNILLKYHNCNIQGFSSIKQTEFNELIQHPVLQDFEDDIEELIIKSDFDRDQNTSMRMDYDIETKENVEVIELKYDLDQWVVVEYKMKKNSQYFVGKIIDKMSSTLEYKILFLRKGHGKLVKFHWPAICDDGIVSESRILQHLGEPEESRRGEFTFKKLPNLNLESRLIRHNVTYMINKE